MQGALIHAMKDAMHTLSHPISSTFQNYPTLTFKSTKIEHTGGNEYNVAGDLTIRGETHPVTFKAEIWWSG